MTGERDTEEEQLEPELRIEWRAAEHDTLAAQTAATVAELAVAAASAAAAAAMESQAAARAAIDASDRARAAAESARQAATAAAEVAQGATIAAEGDHARADRVVESTEAAETEARERFQAAQQLRSTPAELAGLQTYNERFIAGGEAFEFETYNEFLGPTLDVSVDGELVNATPILGNRGFRLATPPARGCEVRVYYRVATF